jgi:ATP-dependent Clp protease ATP-binding subunit ClpA
MAIEFVRARALPESQQITINCQTEGDSLNEILGSGVGYVGSERSSRLNSFFRENDGKEAVVLLDEFEKCKFSAKTSVFCCCCC